MNKLLFTCIMVASAGSLHGMEPEKGKLTPITLPLTYYHFSHDLLLPETDRLLPEIIQHIFSLQLKASGVDSMPFLCLCKYPTIFIMNLKRLLGSCDYDLIKTIFKVLFREANVSICDIKEKESNCTTLHVCVGYRSPIVAKMLIELAGDNIWTLLTTKSAYDGAIPLHFAAGYGCIEIVKIILDAAGDKAIELVKYEDSGGRMPLDYVQDKNTRKEIVQLLEDVVAGKNA